MSPTACPRCAAERQARWVRVAVHLGAGTAVLALLVVFSILSVTSLAMDHNVRALLPLAAWVAEGAPCLFALALAAPCIVLGGCAYLRILVRRSTTPVPAPPADPLATYREALVECPRHPFAR